MGNRQVRTGQLIAPFGPGSIYTDRRGVPLVVGGLDYWYTRENVDAGAIQPCEDRREFERIEPRLSALLHVDRFCLPPDYRHVRRGQSAPPNARLNIPALRFPRWYRHTKTGEMRKFNLTSTRLENPPGSGRWKPVRFIAVCAAGHLCEFPWQDWIGCMCRDAAHLILKDFGGSELTSIRVECTGCGKSGHLAGTTKIPADSQEQSAFQRAGIACPGDRPWLGENANEPGCGQPLVGALINQTNLYFPKTFSAITLPDIELTNDAVAELRAVIEQNAGEFDLGVQRTRWRMGGRRQERVAADVHASLEDIGTTATVDQVRDALESLFEGSGAAIPAGAATPLEQESEFVAFRRAEFNVLREPIDRAAEVPNLRVIATTVASDLSPWLARVNLVERLLETRVFYGFSRLKADSMPLTGMPDSAMRQLFRSTPDAPQDRWLPAVEVFGEGIYIELQEEKLKQWQEANARWLEERIKDDFINRLQDVRLTLPPDAGASRTWASRYLLVHSIAHILINQLVFECGYSTASLRERLYISADPRAPMAAMLIYTAAGDSEGTLGGLVRLGRPERLGLLLQRALSRASWCSADPVCSQHLGGSGSRLANLAACHACALLPETCCETINEGLDRAMVVGMPDNREPGFMSELIESTLAVAYA
ncbi:MAG: hypothetical protein CMLOHMNK_02126 [Steroidobacteraceae bacterium]|nr:hypothetical protein [Steroidobacteraceae bacterium]